jgi:hypothetical protein
LGENPQPPHPRNPEAHLSHHYTSATTEAWEWCKTCGKKTTHDVSSSRLGRCREHHSPELTKAQKKRLEKIAAEQKQPNLFQFNFKDEEKGFK